MNYHFNAKNEKKPCRAKKQCRFNKNRNTVAVYNDESAAIKYVQATPNVVDGSIQKWLDHVHSQIKPQSKIFELGSATGRDAKYLQKMGHVVDVSDISAPFRKELKKVGFSPYKFNALTDAFPDKKYDLILANAVLLHFEKEDTRKFLKKVHNFLIPEGKVAFTLKKGKGEEYSDAKVGKTRYFSYWEEFDVEQVLSNVGFDKYSIQTEDEHGIQWLQVIAEK